MAANCELQKVHEWQGMRGFSNLFKKEHRSWWGTRRWWVNTLLWAVLIVGLTAIMLYGPNGEIADASEAEISQAGGLTAYTLNLGLSIYFEFGVPILAIWTIILSQDLIIGEKQSGVAEWLLSKPVIRSAYVLAKLAAHALPILTLLVGLPSVAVFALLSARMGSLFPVGPFFSAVVIMALHTLFYLTLTLMLGTIFNNRGPILGVALGSVLGGGIVGGFIKPLMSITPWMLPKVALLTASSQMIPVGVGIPAVVSTFLWSAIFIGIALAKSDKIEF